MATAWEQSNSHQKIGDLTSLPMLAGDAQFCCLRGSSQSTLNPFQDTENFSHLASSIPCPHRITLALLGKNSFHPNQHNSKSSLGKKKPKQAKPKTRASGNFKIKNK